MDSVVLDFLQHVAVGTASVLLLLLAVRFGMPRRSVAVSRYRSRA